MRKNMKDIEKHGEAKSSAGRSFPNKGDKVNGSLEGSREGN